MMRGWAGLGKTGRMTSGIMPICSAVLATAMALVLSPSAYADDMGGLWPVKDSAVVSAHEAGLDGSGVKVGMYDMQVVSDYPGLSDADANVEYRLGSFVNATTDGGLQWKHSPQDYFKTFVPDPDHLWNFKTIYQAPGKLSDGVAEASNAIRVGISDL
ncbi:hypothetical protein NL89_04545 [Bifidobacterium longum subsp. longum]|nr:hypothetical protein NL89_04545 [Bifidobacterium longum subsp. longum]